MSKNDRYVSIRRGVDRNALNVADASEKGSGNKAGTERGSPELSVAHIT